MGGKRKSLKISKEVFDLALSAILKTKPMPREKIKTRGQRGPKTPILSRP